MEYAKIPVHDKIFINLSISEDDHLRAFHLSEGTPCGLRPALRTVECAACKNQQAPSAQGFLIRSVCVAPIAREPSKYDTSDYSVRFPWESMTSSCQKGRKLRGKPAPSSEVGEPEDCGLWMPSPRSLPPRATRGHLPEHTEQGVMFAPACPLA